MGGLLDHGVAADDLQADAGSRRKLAATTPDIRAAISLHQQGLLREAEQLYRNVLFDCLHNLGLLLAQSGRFADAAAMLREAIAQDPRSVDAHHNLGNVLAASGDPAGAAQSYRSAIALDEDHDEAHNNLATVLTMQGEMKEALAHYQRALALRPDYVEAHVNLATLFRQQGRLDEAAVHLARAVTLNPGSGALHDQLSKIQRQRAVRTPKIKVDQLLEREYWLALAPGLHIDDRSLFSDVAYLEMNPASAAQIKQEGYFQGSADWGLDVTLMADAVRALSAADLSPVFGYLYDEFWLPFFKLRSQYEALLGGRYYMLPDFWIWNVDPKKSEAGWAPHRDRGRRTLREDGSPQSVTTWIPLSNSTPLNGCMYIVPAQYDPTYGTVDETEMKFDHQSIRALPGKPGDFFIWNQAIYHWGGRSSSRATESRVSMAFEFQAADVPPFNTPFIDPLVGPSFERRLELVAKQIHRYQHMYEVDPKMGAMASMLMAKLAPASADAIEGAPAPAVAPATAPSIATAPPVATARSPALATATASSIVTTQSAARTGNPASWSKVGRNGPCPCGSGKKYKHCHGRAA